MVYFVSINFLHFCIKKPIIQCANTNPNVKYSMQRSQCLKKLPKRPPCKVFQNKMYNIGFFRQHDFNINKSRLFFFKRNYLVGLLYILITSIDNLVRINVYKSICILLILNTYCVINTD